MGEGDAVPRRLSVPESSAQRGEFTVPVKLSEGSGIVAIQFEIFFESDILEVVEILPGSLLTVHEFVVNTSFADFIGAAIVSRDFTTFQSGSGSVLEIVFRNVADQDTELDIANALALAPDGSPIEIEASPTAVVVFPEGIPTADERGLMLLLILLMVSGLALLRKGMV